MVTTVEPIVIHVKRAEDGTWGFRVSDKHYRPSVGTVSDGR